MDGSNPGSPPEGSAASRARAPTDGVPSWLGAPLAQIRAALDISGSATGHTATWARREFTTWLILDLAAGELFDDLVLVVYEALANVVDHAYPNAGGDPGPVQLLARRSHDAIRVTVSDQGTWRHAEAAETSRGHGLPLIRQLIHDVYIDVGSAGTAVHLRSPLPPPAR